MPIEGTRGRGLHSPIHKSATLGKNSASGELIQVGTVGCAAAMIAARERGVIRAWSMAELTGMANCRCCCVKAGESKRGEA